MNDVSPLRALRGVTCRSCKFSSVILDDASGRMLCRFNPPAVQVFVVGMQPTGPQHITFTSWPMVNPDVDRCSKHTPELAGVN